MYGLSNFSKESRRRSQNFLKNFPSTPGHTHSSTRYLSPSGSYQALKQPEPQEFYETFKHIEAELQRILPEFTFNFSIGSPFSQAKTLIAQAIDIILEEQSKIQLLANNVNSVPELEAKIKEDLQKAKETSKHLTRYEHLLSKKNEKIEAKKKELHEERKKLKKIKEETDKAVLNLEEQKKELEIFTKTELEKINYEKNEAQKGIDRAREFIEKTEKRNEENLKNIKVEKENLAQLEACLNQTKQILLQEQKRITQDKLDLEKVKWELGQRQRRLEEEELILNVKIEKFNLEKSSFFKFSGDEKQEPLLTPRGKNSRLALRTPSIDESSIQEKKELEEQRKMIERAFKDFQALADGFNEEMEKKEKNLEERESFIKNQENKVKTSVENLKLIEASLNETASQILELKTSTIPQLEQQSELLEQITQSVIEKKSELEFLTEKITAELSVINGLKSASSEKDVFVGKDIKKMTAELEAKLKQIKKRELELDAAYEELESEKNDVVVAAEYLKKSHIEFDEMRKKYDLEICTEKEKILAQFSMLKLKENELNISRFSQNLTQSSIILEEDDEDIQNDYD